MKTRKILWAWKGNYLNLGAGAEMGIYSNVSGVLGLVDIESPHSAHWLVDTKLAMPMTLTLKNRSGETIFSFTPDENTWWITGFNPFWQGVLATELIAIYTVDFSGHIGMYNDFKNSLDPIETRWTFDDKRYIATFIF